MFDLYSRKSLNGQNKPETETRNNMNMDLTLDIQTKTKTLLMGQNNIYKTNERM